ncbi:MarR family transcriptional regulator [Micromonospora sp. NPDC005161]
MVTNAVDRLESAGLVKRTPHPTDRRTTLVDLLPKGRELTAKATEELNAQGSPDPAYRRTSSRPWSPSSPAPQRRRL